MVTEEDGDIRGIFKAGSDCILAQCFEYCNICHKIVLDNYIQRYKF